MLRPGSTVRAAARSGALLLGLLAASWPQGAAADTADVETARALFVEGTKLANQGRWNEARELYARSLARGRASTAGYRRGVAKKETAPPAAPINSFRPFRAAPPVPATAPYVEPARAAILELEKRTG